MRFKLFLGYMLFVTLQISLMCQKLGLIEIDEVDARDVADAAAASISNPDEGGPNADRDSDACGSLRSNFLVALQESLGMMSLSISSCLIVSGKQPLYWVVSCGRINLVLSLALLKVLFWMFGS